ncbi:MAG TPA: beta-propeller fold lactonase family protein, partial [Candidatus Methylacidiphilales bacterium]
MEKGPEGDAADHPSSAEVAMHPSGKWLYVSNRGWNTATVFAVGADGLLTPVANRALGVKDPRGFALDPSGRWLLAAGQKDDAVTSFKVDPETGRLTPTGQRIAVGSPVAFVFAP